MINLLKQYINIKHSRKKQIPPKTLPILLLWIYDKCNLYCKMCDQWKGNGIKSQMSYSPKICDQWKVKNSRDILNTEELLTILDSAKKLNTRIVSITGGEPLLRHDIFDILNAISKRGFASHLCTNGTLLNNNTALNLAKTNLKSISISIDSINSNTHNFIRGCNCFHKTITGVRLIRKIIPNLRININFLICRLNYKEMPEMINMAKELNVDKVSFAPIHTNLQHKNKSKESFGDLLFHDNDNEELQRQIEKTKIISKQKKILISSNKFLRGIYDFYKKSPPYHKCYAGYSCCAISPWGDVSPCVDMETTNNIRNLPLDIIWNSHNFHNLRKDVENCKQHCWDTTNAEISIRFNVKELFQEFSINVRDLIKYG